MLYRYIAFRRDDGQELQGVLEAPSEEAAEEALWQQDYIVARLRPADSRRYSYVAFRREDGEELRGVLEAPTKELAEQALWQQDYIVARLRPVGTSGPATLLSFLGNRLGDVLFLSLVLALLLGVYAIRTEGHLVAITGRSMEPTLHAGDLLLTRRIVPERVSEGDIIIFNVSPILRETYNYPPVVAHRVTEVVTAGETLAFRTKGDNTGQDPFTVFPRDVRGEPYHRIRFVGFVPLFLQSRQGVFFAIATIILLGVYRYGEELDRGKRSLHQGLLAPIIEAEGQGRRELQQRLEGVEQALERLVEIAMHVPADRSGSDRAVDRAPSAHQPAERVSAEEQTQQQGRAA